MDYRISQLRSYLFNVINSITDTDNSNYQINADFLGNEGDYSLDKIPTSSVIRKWVTGVEVHADTFSLRNKKEYSKEYMNNLENIGFFEKFEKQIKSNNREGVLPDINGIQSIECLNCGTMISSEDGNSAIFDIQIRITYIES